MAVKAYLSQPGTYQDSDGLFLKADTRGEAQRKLRVQRGGKPRARSLGSAKLISPAEARFMAVNARKAVKEAGRDPIAERRAKRAAAGTFRQMAEP